MLRKKQKQRERAEVLPTTKQDIPMPQVKLPKKEFEKRYAERSNLTVEELRTLGVTIEPCDCGDKLCKGWQAVT